MREHMKPRHLPLLLASDQFAGESEAEPLDRLRIQKGVFLLQMRGPEDWRDTYPFAPWDWGPFSHALASMVKTLSARGLLEERPVPFRSYAAYRTTAEGEETLAEAARTLTPKERAFIAGVRHYITSRSFSQLLREVYAEYPKFAVNSRFRG